MYKFLLSFVITMLVIFTNIAQAGTIFALRGDNLAPRYARGGKAYSPFVAAVNLSTLPAVITAASISATGTKGSSLIDVHLTNGDERAIKYLAGSNWVTGTNVFTIRYSFVPNWSGNPASDKNLFLIGHDPNRFNGGIRVMIFDNGKLNIAMRAGDGVSSDMLSHAATSASALTFVNKQKTEIQISSNGTRVYASQDGVAVGDWPLTITTRYMNGVLAGNIYLGVYSVDSYIDEFLIFDSFEAQAYTPSGSYLSVADLDATTSSDPGVANVRSGTGYVIAGASLTGTLSSPSLANTKIGVAGDGGVGTYDGSDRWTCPLDSQLSSGVQLKCNSTSLNLTGTRQTVTNTMSTATMSGQRTSATLTAQ